MLVSQKKKRENIAEYVIYMWQLEDIVRAHDHDPGSVYQFIMRDAQIEPALAADVLNWYTEVCSAVASLAKGRHLAEVHEVLQELSLLHGMLLTTIKDEDYLAVFEKARGSIEELKKRSGSDTVGDVEACFNGMYGVFLLDLQKKPLSDATKEAIKPVRELLKVLSLRYVDMKKGDIGFSMN